MFYNFLLNIFCLFFLISCSKTSIKYHYPESHDSKQFDRVGTLGKSFSYTYDHSEPSPAAKNITKEKNWQELWQMAVKTFEKHDILLNSSDAIAGVIISDWHYINNNLRIKLNLFLSKNGNNTELKLKAVQQTKTNNNWGIPVNNKSYADKIKNEILSN